MDEQIAAVASIAEPRRRDLYRFVAASEAPVGKDEAAAWLGVARSVAAFHLDRLVADGLLVAAYQRRNGRKGPGAGRPAKLYRRADREVSVSLPTRRYSFAASLLATAVTQSAARALPADRTLAAAARRYGRRLGATVTELDSLMSVLVEQGYEPRRRDGEIVLVNCPFHALVGEHRDLVCGMNLDLLAALVAVLPTAGVTAKLQPSDAACCVRLTLPDD